MAAVPSARADEAASVQVDASSDAGVVPLVQQVGTWPFTPVPPVYLQNQFFADFHGGTMEIDLGQEVLRPSSDIGEVMGRLALLDPFLKQLQAHGMSVIIAFSKMPPFLSAAAGNNAAAMSGDASTVTETSPPRDYNAWGNMVGQIVTHIRGLGLHASYNIGWEPDTALWQGTSEDFFKLYKSAVLAVKRADPAARVGGPAVSDFGPQWRDKPTGPAMIDTFLAYAGRTSLPELGLSRLPVDFVSYHLFGGSMATSYAMRTRWLRASLLRNGYDVDTPIFIGEWSSSANATDALREQPFIAAYVIASAAAMARANVNNAAYTSLTEQQVSESTDFNGGFGLFTKSFIKRPSYRAFQMLDALAHTSPGAAGNISLTTTSDLPAIVSLAARGADRVVIVVANFIPAADSFRREFLDRLVGEQHPMSAIVDAVKSVDRIDGIMRGEVDPKSLAPAPLSTDMAATAADIRARATTLAKSVNGSTNVQFVVSNLGWLGAFDLAAYRIDSKNANPALIKDAIDRRMTSVASTSAAEIKRNYRSILQKNGFAPQVIDAVEAFAAGGEQPSALARLDDNMRLNVIKAIRALQAEQDSAIAQVADTFNNDPRLALTAANKQSVAATKQFSINFPLEPEGVLMLELIRK